MKRPQDPSLVQHSLDCSHIINNQVFQKGQLQVMDVGVSAGYKLRKEHPCLGLLNCIGSHTRIPCHSLDWNKEWIYLLHVNICTFCHTKLISSCHQFPDLPSVGQGDLHPAQLRWNWENRESIFPSLLTWQIWTHNRRVRARNSRISEEKKATQNISKSCRY